MINNSYNRIENDSDVEWKFARSKLMLSYFGPGSVNPPPFNIIPSPAMISAVLRHLHVNVKNLLKHSRLSETVTKTTNTKTRTRSQKQKLTEQCIVESSYADISRRLVKRYVIKAQVEKESESINEGEIQEIKQDISSLRYELLELNKNYTVQLQTVIGIVSDLKNTYRQGARRLSS